MPKTCASNQILRKTFTRKGRKYPPACIRRVSPYSQRYGNFQKQELKKMTRRLRGYRKASRGNTKVCADGSILRKAYVVMPSKRLVKGSCIKKRGLSVSGARIGPLRKGEMAKFGYVGVKDLSLKERRGALAKAVAALGSLSVWKKVNVLSVFFKNTSPELSAKFNQDKNWIKATYGLKAF